MPLLREYRLRHQYGARYDFRGNLMDWDYQFRLKPNTGIIHPKQFKTWRETGVAFEFGDSTYTNPNRSLLSYAEGREQGRSRLRRGFWGDVAVSPYHAVGTSAFTGLGSNVKGAAKAQLPHELQCYPQSKLRYAPGVPKATAQKRAAELFDVHSRHSGSEQWRHHSVEVAVFNLLSHLHELEHHSMYTLSVPHGIYSGLGEKHSNTSAAQGKSEVDQHEPAAAAAAASSSSSATALACGVGDGATARRARCIASSLAGVSIVPCDGSDMRTTLQRIADRPTHALHSAVDVCVVGSKAAHLLAAPEQTTDSEASGTIHCMLRANAVLIVETARNVVKFTEQQCVEYERKVLGMAAAGGLAFVARGRDLDGDTHAAGSVVTPEKKPSVQRDPPVLPAALATRAFAYASHNLDNPDVQRGDNPAAEHLVFANFPEHSVSVKQAWAKSKPE